MVGFMYGYRAVELIPDKEYGIELDANVIKRGLSSWEAAEDLADMLNKAYANALEHIKAK
jgi:hypothetical protein